MRASTSASCSSPGVLLALLLAIASVVPRVASASPAENRAAADVPPAGPSVGSISNGQGSPGNGLQLKLLDMEKRRDALTVALIPEGVVTGIGVVLIGGGLILAFAQPGCSGGGSSGTSCPAEIVLGGVMAVTGCVPLVIGGVLLVADVIALQVTRGEIGDVQRSLASSDGAPSAAAPLAHPGWVVARF